MGIESDQLVYDYLSRVGDLAQRQLSSGDRMRLVSSLRAEIDRQRGRSDGEGTATVLRILGRLGTPAEQVAAAVDGVLPGSPQTAGVDAGALRGVRDGGLSDGGPRDGGLRDGEVQDGGVQDRGAKERGAREWGVRERARRIPRPRRTEKAEPPPRPTGALPPHLAGEDALGPSGSSPDWWRIESSPFGPGEAVPGFTGGVEIPEILRPPAREKAVADTEEDVEGEVEDALGEAENVEDAAAGEPGPRRRLRLRRRSPATAGTSVAPRAFSSRILLLAALALVVGVVLGNLLVLGVGWLLAYTSRSLSRLEAKWAVLGLPGLAAAGGLVWLWGRADGRWGTPIAAHGMGDAVSGVWPVVLRVAAGASALYLIWRARRAVG